MNPGVQRSVPKAAQRDRSAILVAIARDRYRAPTTLETNVAQVAVKWFHPTKGDGFIQSSAGGSGKDAFVHTSVVDAA
jgi:hypothetical protein